MTDSLLAMNGVTKRFGGVTALNDVHFDLLPGEIHALMGENGAGKSTLMKILSGVYTPDAGSIRILGEAVTISGPADALTKGVAIIHQELNNIPHMTVAENLALGNEPSRGGVLNRGELRRQAREKLARIGADIPVDMPVGRLSVGMQQMVEIARAVAEDAKILILDEPTAALSRGETERLLDLVEEMRDSGMGLIYISHRMEEVWRLANRITVFRDGAWVSTTTREEATPAQIVNRMVGRNIGNLYVNEDRIIGEPVLTAAGITDGRGVGPVDLTIRSGEVLGLVGLIGAGRTEVARMLFGADPMDSGEVTLAGKDVRIRSPRDAIAAGIGLVPESRKEQALFLDMSIRDNTVMSSLPEYSVAGVMKLRAIATAVRKQTEGLKVRNSSLGQSVASLSGGNQQKVVLARWLMMAPRVLILDEPTRGVDIGAKQEIYRLINELAKSGVGILLISSDLPEALGISDRIIVARNGRFVKEFSGTSASEHMVMMWATGVARGDVTADTESQVEKEQQA
ncbi:MAG: araG [Microbacteriaceae bacterium]|nr:araG [Microbacteriaceae bacterium]